MSERLDRLARGLAGLTSRREMIKYLAGALFLGAGGCNCRTFRHCERVCSTCKGDGAQINCLIVCDTCRPERLCGACATLSCCNRGSTCCPDTSGTAASGTCTNTQTDPVNCGGCSYGAGATGTDCTNPDLLLIVPGCCGGVCTDLSSTSTCGSCTNACDTTSGQVCCTYFSGGTQGAACCAPVGTATTGTCCTTDSDCAGLTRSDSTTATCNSTGCCA